MYTFVGTCTYTLVKSVSYNVNPITILGKNEDRGLRGATYLKEVYIDVYGTRITLRKSKEILEAIFCLNCFQSKGTIFQPSSYFLLNAMQAQSAELISLLSCKHLAR